MAGRMSSLCLSIYDAWRKGPSYLVEMCLTGLTATMESLVKDGVFRPSG